MCNKTKYIEGLTTSQLLCNGDFVSHVDFLGRRRFKDWDVDAFICGRLGAGEYRPNLDMASIDYSGIDGLALNSLDGVHYGYELCLKPLDQWPLRGAPFFWAELARNLTRLVLPLDGAQVVAIVRDMMERHGIPPVGDEWILVPEYCRGAHSGMSTGAITAAGVNIIMDEILRRNSLFREAPGRFLEEYVARFEDFPFLY